MYLSPWKFFRNQILLDYLGRWRFFQSVHSGVSGKGSNFAIFSANRRWPLQLLYYHTTVIIIIIITNIIFLNCVEEWFEWNGLAHIMEVATNDIKSLYILLLYKLYKLY